MSVKGGTQQASRWQTPNRKHVKESKVFLYRLDLPSDQEKRDRGHRET
jgi:hypothetical protein